jgi:hypothetical protein
VRYQGTFANYDAFLRDLDTDFNRNDKTWLDDGRYGYYLVLAWSRKGNFLPEGPGKREKMDRDLEVVKKALETEKDPTWFKIRRSKRVKEL